VAMLPAVRLYANEVDFFCLGFLFFFWLNGGVFWVGVGS